MIQKWDPSKRKYEPYQPPADNVSLYETDMDKVISCAGCGKQITFGEGYSSLQIHNAMGMGYSVCESCHDAELKKKLWYEGV